MAGECRVRPPQVNGGLAPNCHAFPRHTRVGHLRPLPHRSCLGAAGVDAKFHRFMNSVPAKTLAPAEILVRLRTLSLATPAGELLCVVALCPILLSIAAWNGFPIIFYDTGAYILEGLGHVFVPERASVYSLLLFYLDAGRSLWFVAGLQALITAFVLTELARAEFTELPIWSLLLIVALLVYLTGIAWYVGQIEPDIMTPVTVIALFLLAYRASLLGATRTILLVLVGALAVASHPGNLLLAAGLLLVLAAVRVSAIFLPRLDAVKPSLSATFGTFTLASVLVLSANYTLTNQWFFSRTGSYFAFARMLQDGIVQKLLDDTCPQSRYPLCPFKNSLPHRADSWLWNGDSPFNRFNRFHGPVSLYEDMIADSVRRYPVTNAVAALKDTALQFVRFRTGDQIEPQEWVLYSDLAHYIPGQMESYMRARQQRGELRFENINRVHVPVAILSLLGLLFLLRTAYVRREWQQATLPAFVLLSLLGNAFICGTLSNPHDRYQSRLMWVPAFVLSISAVQARLFSLQRPVESGT